VWSARKRTFEIALAHVVGTLSAAVLMALRGLSWVRSAVRTVIAVGQHVIEKRSETSDTPEADVVVRNSSNT